MSAGVMESKVVVMPDVPDDFELVHGRLVECPPMSAYSVVIVNAIKDEMLLNDAARQLGRSLVEQYFWIPT